MLFNSAIFVVFFFAVYLLYWQLPIRAKHYLIILASMVFYAWYSVPFLILFLALIVFNYAISMRLIEKKSKALVLLAILVDGSTLVFFKYFYLFAEGIGQLLGLSYLIDLKANWLRDHNFEIILPIAISFYTFQIIAFVVDCYRGTVEERLPFRKFCVFILFFPQFVAGPILRAGDFIPQIDNPKPSQDRMLNGCLLFLMGVLKKVLIADRIGLLTGPVWQNPERYDATTLLLILPGFVCQVYCDFSGYTDMARGMAKLLGYEIPENFRGPFLSLTIRELWTRWHITLSSWLRDYIYIPLGGSRQGELRTAINLLLTMALGGLWHGASWNMLFWGLYLGLLMVFERALAPLQIRILPEGRLSRNVRRVKTFALASFSGVFFAAPDMERTFAILKGLANFQRARPMEAPDALLGLVVLTLLLNVLQYYPSVREKLGGQRTFRYAFLAFSAALIGFLVNLYGDISGSFIYFQF